MLNWGKNIAEDYFVVTSNVDGQFQKAGFDPFKIYEIHGSIHHLQCLAPCCDAIWENNENIQIDYETMRAKNIPKCRFCDRVARPNILMFGDYSWLPQRSHEQSDRFDNVIQNASGKNIVVVEVGAGTAVPSIRYTSERLGRRDNTTVIRINLRESQIAGNHISIPMRGLEALKMIDEELNG
jgi:NAD-dependent SIR2 family protein deacetylase